MDITHRSLRFIKVLLLLFIFCAFFASPTIAAAVAYNTLPASSSETQYVNTGGMGSARVTITKNYYNSNIGMHLNRMGTTEVAGYYTICTGTNCAIYKDNKPNNASDDQLIGVSNKDNYFQFQSPILKDGKQDRAALLTMQRQGTIKEDGDVYNALINHDTGALKNNVQNATQMRQELEKLEKEIADLQNKEGRTNEDDARLAQLQARYNELKPQYDGTREAIINQENTRKTQDALSGAAVTSYTSFCNLGVFTITGGWKTTFDFTKCLIGVLQLFADLLSWLLALSAVFFDLVIKYTIVTFSTLVNTGGAFKQSIEAVWQLIKNLSNLIFIGILLYIAVMTVIKGEGIQEKSKLKSVIILAFLINFSMFFTKLLIDVSNTASIEMYNTIISQPSVANSTSLNTVTGAKSSGFTSTDTPLADAFLSGMQITKFFDGQANDGVILLRTVLNIFVIIVAMIVFASAGVMFIIRFFMIIFLMMTSPIGYVGYLLPFTQGLGKTWWDAFKGNLVFAPAYMVMVYVSLQLISFSAASSIGQSGGATVPGQNPDLVTTLIMYSISIISLVACLVVAKKAGGSAAAADWGSGYARKFIGGSTFGLAARAGRATIGAAGSSIANSSTLKRLASSNSLLNRMSGASALARGTLKGGEKLSKSTFDARNTGLSKKVDLGTGLKGGFDSLKKEEDALRKMRKESLDLSPNEELEKASTDNFSKAFKDKSKSEEEQKEKNRQLALHDNDLNKAKAELKIEQAKIEAEVKAQFAAEEAKLQTELADLQKKLASSTDAKTQADYQQRIKANEKRRGDLDIEKVKIVNDSKTNRTSALDRRIKDIEEKREGVIQEKRKIEDVLDKAQKRYDNAVKQLSEMGVKTTEDNLKKLRERNKALSDKEEANSKEYFKFVKAGTTGIGGVFNGRNEAYKKEFLKMVRDKMKDKSTKDFEKLMKEAMKKHEEGGGEEAATEAAAAPSGGGSSSSGSRSSGSVSSSGSRSTSQPQSQPH